MMLETRYMSVVKVTHITAQDFSDVTLDLSVESGASTTKITYVLPKGASVPTVGDRYVVSVRPEWPVE
jgi:hypothetical protein